MLLTSGNRRADLKVLNIRVAQMTDLRVDVSLRHDFIGAGRDGERTHGKLRNEKEVRWGRKPDTRVSTQPRQPGSDPRDRSSSDSTLNAFDTSK